MSHGYSPAPAEGEVVKTMIRLRHEHRDAGTMRGVSDGGVHPKFPCRRDPFDALEKQARLLVTMLIGVEDVAAALENPT